MGKPRAQEWFKFTPVFVSDEIDGLSLEATGAYFKLAMFLMNRGPQPREVLATRVGRSFNEVERTLTDVEGGVSMAWVEEVRAENLARKKQTSEAGQKSAATRTSKPEQGDERSTPVQHPLNERSTDAQRASYSKSSSESKSESSSGSFSESDARAEEKKDPPKPRKVPDERINRCIDLFTAKAGHKPADASKWLRIHVTNLLNWIEGKATPEHPDAVENIGTLIDAALMLDFHKNNATTFQYLYKYRETIFKTFKDNPNGKSSKGSPLTPEQTAQRVAEYFDRERARGGPDA